MAIPRFPSASRVVDERLELKARELHRQNLASAKSLTDNSEPHQPASKYNAKKAEQEQEKQYEMDAANLRMFKKLSAIEALDSSSFLLPSHTRSGLATKPGMYYAHVGGSHFQCLDHINLNAMNLPCGPYYRGLRSSLRSSSGLSSSRPGSRSSSGGALTMTMTGSNAINGSIIRVGESADGLPVKADTRTANEQQGDGDLSVPRGGEGLVHGSSTTLKITPLVGPRHWPAGRRQMASRRRKLVVVRTPAAPMTDGDVLNSDSDSAYPEQHTTLPVLKQQQRSTDSRGGSETSPLQLMARTGSRDFCSGGGGGSGGGSGAGSLSCFGTRSLGRGDVLSKVYLASANVERKGNDLVASRRSKPYFGRAISSELPQQGTAATASTRASVGSF